MDILDEWAITIARQTVPDEVDLAPALTHAFVAGSTQRAELFRREWSGGAAAFGPGDVMLFPVILQAITAAGPLLSAIFQPVSASILASSLSSINSALSIKERQQRKKQIASSPDDRHDSITRAIDVIDRVLRSAKIPPEESDMLTLRIIKALLENPDGTRVFHQRVEAAG